MLQPFNQKFHTALCFFRGVCPDAAYDQRTFPSGMELINSDDDIRSVAADIFNERQKLVQDPAVQQNRPGASFGDILKNLLPLHRSAERIPDQFNSRFFRGFRQNVVPWKGVIEKTQHAAVSAFLETATGIVQRVLYIIEQ